MDYIDIKISDFSKTPGPREKREGPFSGELFSEEVLMPKFKTALDEGKKIKVDVDGTVGYMTSFLEEVFGGLARKFGAKVVRDNLEVISTEEPYLIDDINGYIDDVETEENNAKD